MSRQAACNAVKFYCKPVLIAAYWLRLSGTGYSARTDIYIQRDEHFRLAATPCFALGMRKD